MEELAKMTPVSPPIVNKKINPRAHISWGEKTIGAP